MQALEISQRLAKDNPKTYGSNLAGTLNNLALLYWNTQRFQEADTLFDELLALSRKLSVLSNTLNLQYVNLLFKLSQLYSKAHKYESAYKVYKEWLPTLKQQYEDNPALLRSDLVRDLCNQSFYAIIVKQYAEAEQYAREGLKVDSTQHWIASNLAASLLLQGRYSEAEPIYRQYKDELKESFLDDFEQFKAAGVIPKECEEDVEKIKRMLEE